MLKAIRQNIGISQKALAEASGVNVRQIQKVESGEIKPENITLGNAIRLAGALGVEPIDLISVCQNSM